MPDRGGGSRLSLIDAIDPSRGLNFLEYSTRLRQPRGGSGREFGQGVLVNGFGPEIAGGGNSSKRSDEYFTALPDRCDLCHDYRHYPTGWRVLGENASLGVIEVTKGG